MRDFQDAYRDLLYIADNITDEYLTKDYRDRIRENFLDESNEDVIALENFYQFCRTPLGVSRPNDKRTMRGNVKDDLKYIGENFDHMGFVFSTIKQKLSKIPDRRVRQMAQSIYRGLIKSAPDFQKRADTFDRYVGHYDACEIVEAIAAFARLSGIVEVEKGEHIVWH